MTTEMSSCISLASLQTKNRNHPIIRFETFDPIHDRLRLTKHSIAGYYLIFDNAGSECAPKYKKAYSRGRKAAQRLIGLLNGHDMIRSRHHLPRLFLLSTAVVGGPPSHGHARDLEGITAFHKMDFQFSHTSTQFLHVSAPTLKADDTLIHRDGSATFDHVEILSGICLFSMHILHGSINSMGGLRIDMLRTAPLTLYEMDYIARASPAIADLTCIAISRCRDLTTTIRVKLDIPSWQYYQSIAEQIESKACTMKEACQWMDAVEARHDQVKDTFTKAITSEFLIRDFGAACEVVVCPRETLPSVVIRHSLEQDRLLSVRTVLESLWNEDEGGWREFYSLIAEKDRPQDFRALGYVYYVFQVVQPALLKKIYPNEGTRDAQKPRPRRLLISIDDRSEQKIYSRAQKLLKKIRQNENAATNPTLVENYLDKRIFINDNQDGSNLYLDDTTPALARIIDPLQESENEAALVQSQEIIKRVYGTRSWMG